VHIGTHSHDIELDLRTLFRQNGWYKLNDYSCQSTETTPWGDIAFGDGVQTWINPRLSPVQPTTIALNHLQEVLATSERREAQLKLNLHSLQQENDQLRAGLAQSQQESAQLRTSLAQSQQEGAQLRMSLEESQQEGAQLRTSLEESQQEGAQLRTSLERSQQKNGQLQAEAAQLKAVNAAMERGKLWKLRQAWLRLKGAVGIKSE
jgi:chromosome segregation ATPase